MADRYIDNGEVSEYGRYLWARSARLVGASRLVDMAEFRQVLLGAVEDVESHRNSTQTQKSGLRTGQSSLAEAVPETRDVLRRFHSHLDTLPATAAVDVEAFFPAGKLGRLNDLKPADLLARADEVLHGFTVPANATLPQAAGWQSEILARRTALSDALAGKHEARGSASSSSGSLATARERFLHVYNVLAKRLVHVVLADIGQLDEYRSYFLDLQVNEGGSRSTPEVPEAPAGDDAGAVP